MIEVICEFVVKDETQGQFELAFGPGGAWSKLFAECPGFRGTTLLRDMRDSRHYLSIELWDAEAQRQQMLAERQAEYTDLDATLAEWTESKIDVGVFRVLAEATVRPRGRARRSSRRSNRA